MKRINLIAPSFNRYSASFTVSEQQTIAAYQANMQLLFTRFHNGEPCYVDFEDARRAGSVGRITAMTMTPVKASQYSYYSHRYDHYHISGLTIEWDGRSNKCSPYASDITYLPDHAGPTVWAYAKSVKREIVIPTIHDRLGEEVKVGNFVSFVYQKYGQVDIMYGTVTRINENGTVWAKNMKLSADDTSEEQRIRNNETIVILEKNFMDKLMMFKLSLL